MNDKNLTHDESLQIIQSMILTARNRITENGFHFLLWGILVIVASIVEYIMQKTGNRLQENLPLSWMIMPVIGLPIAFIYEYRRNRKGRTQGHIDTWFKFLWLGFGITLVITIAISVLHHMSPIPFILALVGFATFVSGSIYKFTPLILGGIIFWISSLLCIVFPGPEQLLINAGATLIGYILPGILLWKKSRKADNV